MADTGAKTTDEESEIEEKRACRQILVVPILIISKALLGLFTISSQQSSRLGLLPNSVREGVESA